MIRDDTQAQLVPTVRELGFQYIRFHDVFHDTLGTVRRVDGKIVYDWTQLDQLYDALWPRASGRSWSWASPRTP